MTQKTISNPWLYDVRVRERNLRSGALDEKELDKHLSQLPDAASQAEPFGLPQPALAQPEPEPEQAPAEEPELGPEPVAISAPVADAAPVEPPQ